MVKFQRLIIMAVILLGFNFKANAELVVESNGRVRVSTGGFNKNGIKTWRYLDNGRGGMGGNMFYHEISSKSLAVREGSTGLRSASTVPVTIEQKVSRSTVLRNLLSKAKIGGKFARVGGGPVGFAVSIAAFYLVEQMLADEGYKYDVTLDDFVTDKEYVIVITPNDERNYGKNKFELARFGLSKDSYDYGYTSYKSTLDGLCDRASKNVDDYAKSQGYESHIAKEYKGSDSNGGCRAITAYGFSTKAFWRIEPNKKQPISQSEFDRIVGPNADRNPTPYVNATANEDGSIPGATVSTPSVPNGTVITLGPATGQDGRPFQITISFTTGADGNTTATVTTTPRPDLTPGSPAAPKTNPTPTPGENGKPGSQPDPNPDGKPGSQPDPTPDGSPSDKTKPDPDGSPGGKDKPDPNNTPDGKDDHKPDDKPKEDEKPKEDGGLLCKVFPNILACDELPEKEEPNLEIPQETIDLNFTPDNTFSEYGECPAPVTFQALGAEYKISLEPACNLAAMMRPFIIAMAWLVASFFVARVVRNNA